MSDIDQKRNRIRCKRCDAIIESKHRHDFVTCKCGAVSVDDGPAYRKRLHPGDRWQDHYEEMP